MAATLSWLAVANSDFRCFLANFRAFFALLSSQAWPGSSFSCHSISYCHQTDSHFLSLSSRCLRPHWSLRYYWSAIALDFWSGFAINDSERCSQMGSRRHSWKERQVSVLSDSCREFKPGKKQASRSAICHQLWYHLDCHYFHRTVIQHWVKSYALHPFAL